MTISEQEIRQLFGRFNSCKVLVIGDVMVDSYLIGKVDRISPEAPVPVVALTKRENMLGGAANVALNIKSLGGKAILCSVIGNDKQGDILLKLMQDEGLRTDGIIRSTDRITTTKFRIISNRMQMLRVDEEIDSDLNSNDSTALIQSITQLIRKNKPDVIIFQDYNKGVLTSHVIENISSLAEAQVISIAVDPKKKNFMAYKGITLFKPNLKEITEGLKIDVDPNDIESLREAAMVLHSNHHIKLVMITLSEYGIFISAKNEHGFDSIIIPAIMRSIADVSGAGDTVISVAALCLAAKTTPGLLASLSNIAGGLVCEQSGVVPVDKARLLEEAIIELK